MNVQQAAAIYVRGVLEQAGDQLADLIHADFRAMHGQGVAEASDDAIYQAVTAFQKEIGLTVTDIDMHHAIETLKADAWARVEGEVTA